MSNNLSKSGYITGERIHKERDIERRMSLDELANEIEKKIGKRPKRQTISSWERGLTTPDLKQLKALAEIFECDISYLLGDIDERYVATAKILEKSGLSERATNNLITANKNFNPYINVLSALLEDETLLTYLSKCITADYGKLSTCVEINDIFAPKGTQPVIITPRNIRQCDKMDLYNNLCKFIDSERCKLRLPSYNDL